MLPLLEEMPGVVVLHDFYLGNLLHWIERSVDEKSWIQALYESHGYNAIVARNKNAEYAASFYPVNGKILQYATGIIVHSEYSKKLAEKWYARDLLCDWKVIPLLRATVKVSDRNSSRQKIGMKKDDYLVCSFGFMGHTKLNSELLDAWINSALAQNKNCRLIFVGEIDAGEYGINLTKKIQSSDCKDRIHITGFVSSEYLQYYLNAANLAVQLRTQSRGETSAAVLDCMNHGLPVIVNANGAMAEFDNSTVLMLPDEFEESMLIEAIEIFYKSPDLGAKIGKRAQEYVHSLHSPDMCAVKYAEAIEDFYKKNKNTLPVLIEALTEVIDRSISDANLKQVAEVLALNHPLPKVTKRLYLDVTATCRHDIKTGIQRVVRALTLALIETPPQGYRIEPVVLSDENGVWRYRLAKNYAFELLNCSEPDIEDEVIVPDAGDILLLLDFTGSFLIHADKYGLYDFYRNQGVFTCAVVYDLLPVRMPDVFPPGADQAHAEWLAAISKFDGTFCISKAVADDLRDWQTSSNIDAIKNHKQIIGWFHLGADINQSAPSIGLPIDSSGVLKKLRSFPTFLMVGTIEPRKGYLQVIEAFSLLWKQGYDINLVVVGNEGWKGWVPPEMRRDIPEIVQQLRTHDEVGRRLFWLEGISDQYLNEIYTASACLIAASYGEGFGLPLIEAAQHKVPIIARDIPVFREVATDWASYFPDHLTPTVIVQAVKDWLNLNQSGAVPQSDAMPWLTWKQSASMLSNKLMESFNYE